MSCIWDWDEEGSRRVRHVAEPNRGVCPVPATRTNAEHWIHVVAGSGTAPDGSALREGSTYLHRPFDAAPEFLAGPDGLEVVHFGPRRPPRAFDEPHPGPRVCHLDDCEIHRDSHDRVDLSEHMIGDVVGSEHSGIGLVTLAPGKRGYPHHVHSAEDERFVVLSGSGTAYLNDERHPVARGSVVDAPARGPAHSFEAGPDGLVYLAWGEREPGDNDYMPESGKVMLRGLRTIFRPEQLTYWDGEPT
jgi:uncharacterized cupin superfamily protein